MKNVGFKCIIYKKIDYVCFGFDKCILLIITTQRQINNNIQLINKMVFSLFDILYVTMGILFVFKYFGSNKNIKNPNTNTSLVTDDINYFITEQNDGDRIILYYEECGDSCMMDYNYDIKYDILRDYNNTHSNYDTNMETNEIEVIYM
jgi:hypothetical protein